MSVPELERLGEGLLAFSSLENLSAWLYLQQ
ncbi:MAG: DUF4351 domain-containing protein [Acaryochloridaceae cyanobacterium SU_2_1]|nr:DUF4351 domain-containing protein [Acaryochloridaceae cyanobacterium SU_2_1]